MQGKKLTNFLQKKYNQVSSSYVIKPFIFVLKTGFVAFLGFLSIVVILNTLNNCCPDVYRWLTYWANQKEVPTLKSCKFKKLPMNDFKQFTWYNVEIELDKKGRASAVIFPTREYLSIQTVDGPVIPAMTKDEPYLVLWKKKFGDKPLLVRIQANNEYESFEEGVQYSYYDCPIKVEFLVDE